MKRCSKCGNLKDESCFSKISKNSDKLRSWCKDCCNEYAKNYTQSKKIEKGEEIISLKITNNKVKDLFDVQNLKDIPLSIRKTIKLPKKLTCNKDSSFNIKSQITNVLRRSQNKVVHISQIRVAYYRMYGTMLSSIALSRYLFAMKKHDKCLVCQTKGYYKYENKEF